MTEWIRRVARGGGAGWRQRANVRFNMPVCELGGLMRPGITGIQGDIGKNGNTSGCSGFDYVWTQRNLPRPALDRLWCGPRPVFDGRRLKSLGYCLFNIKFTYCCKYLYHHINVFILSICRLIWVSTVGRRQLSWGKDQAASFIRGGPVDSLQDNHVSWGTTRSLVFEARGAIEVTIPDRTPVYLFLVAETEVMEGAPLHLPFIDLTLLPR